LRIQLRLLKILHSNETQTPEDSLTSRQLKQKNFQRGKNFKNFEGLSACLVIHDATSLIKLHRILKHEKKLDKGQRIG
jgi:hypothetical protein